MRTQGVLIAVIAVFIVAGCISALQAEGIVHFHNGRVLKVAAYENDGDWIILLIDDQGEMWVPLAHISRIEAVDTNGRPLAPGAQTNMMKRRLRSAETRHFSSGEVVSDKYSESKATDTIPEEYLQRIRERQQRDEFVRKRIWDYPFRNLLERGHTMTEEELKQEKARVMEEMSKRIRTVYGAPRKGGKQ